MKIEEMNQPNDIEKRDGKPTQEQIARKLAGLSEKYWETLAEDKKAPWYRAANVYTEDFSTITKERDDLDKMADNLTKDVDHHSNLNMQYEEEVKQLRTQLELEQSKNALLLEAAKDNLGSLRMTLKDRQNTFGDTVDYSAQQEHINKLESAIQSAPNLVARVRELEELAKSMEWSASFRDGQGHNHKCCPKCLAFMEDGHLADCKLHQTLNNQK